MRQVGIDLLVGIDPLKLTFLGPKFSPAAQKKTQKFFACGGLSALIERFYPLKIFACGAFSALVERIYTQNFPPAAGFPL